MFPFDMPENTMSIACRHIFNEGKPILEVYHDEDGIWQFVCDDNHTDEKDGMVVCLKDIYEHDPSVAPLSKLPRGMYAKRASKDAEWINDIIISS